MSKQYRLSIVFLIGCTLTNYAQSIDSTMVDAEKEAITTAPPSPIQDSLSVNTQVQPEKAQKLSNTPAYTVPLEEETPDLPSIGFGIGMLTYYGDISLSNRSNGALMSRMAYHLYLDQKINDYLSLNLFFIKGKTGANERSLSRNVNFISDISILGAKAIYNFNHFIPASRYITPYISLGFESVEFLSKTDLYDANRNLYHYWSDGSIRSLSETDENASTATRLERDYTYESDVRETNPDGSGKYKERTYAIPLGLGVKMELTEQITFALGTELHFTTTDLIDGITQNSVGNRKGNAANDKLLHTNFSILYNLNPIINEASKVRLSPDDIMAMDLDGDGVQDFHDKCPETPELVEVGPDGCPFDGDGDGVPDYKDDELDTPSGLMVKENGVGYTDADYLAMAEAYNNSGGGVMDTIRTLTYSDGMSEQDKEKFMVRIGEFTGGLPQEVAEELLSIPDVNTWEENGVTYITVGDYNNVPDALRRQIELGKEGFTTSSVVSTISGKTPKAVTNTSDYTASEAYFTPTNIEDPDNEFVYRVQIGAFRNRIPKNVFRDVPGVMMVPFEDGISRFYTGAYNTFEEAAEVRINMIAKGYEGTFISVFKNGKRVSLKEAGVNFVPNAQKVISKSGDEGSSSVNADFVKFSVQIGAWKGEVPAEVLSVVLTLESLKRERTAEGLVRYYSGSFDTPQEAEKFKAELIAKGLTGSMVIGRFKSQTITEQEAIELLK